MVAGKPQTRCAGPISGDHLGVSFLPLPLQSISLNTATPFPWIGPTAAENVRTGFRSIFENAPLPAARCNPQGEIIEMNSAFAHALQAGLADQRALRLTDLVAPDDREATESLLHNLLDCTCDTIRLAGRKTAKNGQGGRAVTNWMAWRLPGSGEEPNHALLIAEPDRHSSPHEEGLLQAQTGEAVGRLAGGIVHDFNNFQSGVMLYCDLLLTSLDSCDRRRRYVDEIRSATMQASGLVQQLLVFARPQASPVRALCLNQIVQALQDLLTRLIGENIVLELSLDPDLGPVTIDQAQAQQIFLNLVLNARGVLPNGGGLVVKTTNGQFQNIPGPERVGPAPAFPDVVIPHSDTSRYVPYNISGIQEGITLMTSAAVSPMIALPQSMAANFLNLLIVDDERSIREACREVARSLGFVAHVADSAEHAYRLLQTQSIDAVLLDLQLPGAGGLEVLRQIKSQRPEALVIVVTGYGTDQSAVQAMKHGAYEYVTKPFSIDQLKLLLDRVSNHLKLKTENRILREKLKSKQGFGGLVGRAPEMEKLYRIISKAANSTHPVLILGESGTGKEMVARSIHYSGPFRDRPFIPIDCGSLVPTLIESELFGYVRGAFTGANQAKDGLLAIAEGGTVFLDEVGELPVDLQSKLLRAIQEKEIRPVGSTRRIPINVRILAATNRDLEQAVTEGAFRRDLYFRLNVLSLRIPPLRERREDIPLLTAHFMERASRASAQEKILSDEAIKVMLAYDWPGNVRELENCLERTCAFTSGPLIHVLDLPPAIASTAIVTPGNGNGNGHHKIVTIAELEKHTILSAIAELNGDKLQAARLLGIGKTTLYRKLKDYAANA